MSMKKEKSTPKQPRPSSSLGETAYVPSRNPRAPAEGKRDSSGLIHCCSCSTVHPSLPEFIQHCKSRQHCRLLEKSGTEGVGNDNNNNLEDDIDIRREIDQMKGCLLELMKQGLEQDRLTADNFDEMRESIKFELKRNSGALAMIIEKVQEIDEKVLEIDRIISSCSLKVENNEKDLDSCFDCHQDLSVKMAQLDQDFKALQKKDSIGHDDIKVTIRELQEDVSRCKKHLHDVDNAKPLNVGSRSSLAILILLLAGVAIFVLLAIVLF